CLAPYCDAVVVRLVRQNISDSAVRTVRKAKGDFSHSLDPSSRLMIGLFVDRLLHLNEAGL
ncbi:MAG: hypothetical protein ACI8Z1_001734, partial [Candidatus Azotimanducaceae bacterium]